MQQELNIAVFKAAVMLFDRLQLSPSDGTTGEDIAHAVSRLFIRYASFLLKTWEVTRYDGNVSSLYRLLLVVKRTLSVLVAERRSHLGEVLVVEDPSPAAGGRTERTSDQWDGIAR